MHDASASERSTDLHYPVIVVGGGQAGLAMSFCLKERGIDHLIFEKHRIGNASFPDSTITEMILTALWPRKKSFSTSRPTHDLSIHRLGKGFWYQIFGPTTLGYLR